MTRPAGLILDYGNVLTRAQDQTWMDGVAQRLGTATPAFQVAYWQHRHAYDSDLTAAEYWGRVRAAPRPGAGALDPVDLAWLIESDIASWSIYHEEVWTLAAEFRRSRGRTAWTGSGWPRGKRSSWTIAPTISRAPRGSVCGRCTGWARTRWTGCGPCSARRRSRHRRAGRAGHQPGQFPATHEGIPRDAIIAEPT